MPQNTRIPFRCIDDFFPSRYLRVSLIATSVSRSYAGLGISSRIHHVTFRRLRIFAPEKLEVRPQRCRVVKRLKGLHPAPSLRIPSPTEVHSIPHSLPPSAFRSLRAPEPPNQPTAYSISNGSDKGDSWLRPASKPYSTPCVVSFVHDTCDAPKCETSAYPDKKLSIHFRWGVCATRGWDGMIRCRTPRGRRD